MAGRTNLIRSISALQLPEYLACDIHLRQPHQVQKFIYSIQIITIGTIFLFKFHLTPTLQLECFAPYKLQRHGQEVWKHKRMQWWSVQDKPLSSYSRLILLQQTAMLVCEGFGITVSHCSPLASIERDRAAAETNVHSVTIVTSTAQSHPYSYTSILFKHQSTSHLLGHSDLKLIQPPLWPGTQQSTVKHTTKCFETAPVTLLSNKKLIIK